MPKDFSKQFARALTGGKISDVVSKKFRNDSVAKQITSELQNPEGNAWVGEMNAQLETVEKATAEVRNATKISQNPILQSSAENIESSGAESVSTDNGTFTAEEQQILNTPDNKLTPEQLTVKQGLIARQQNVGQSAPSGAVESSAEGNLQSSAKRKITAEEQSEARERIQKTAQKLDKDVKVVYVPRNGAELNGKKGKYVADTKTMYLAEDLDSKEAYVEVFKHEFVHRLELRKVYDSFKNYLFNKSEAFGDYALSRLARLDEQLGREKIQRTAEQAKKELVQMYLDNFKNDNSIPQDIRDKFTVEKAEKEAVADFVARVLFKGNDASLRIALKEKDIDRFTNMETDINLLEEIAQNDRNLFQKIVDAIRDFINNIKFMPNLKDLEQDIKYLEERLARVYESGDKKGGNTGEVVYKGKIKAVAETTAGNNDVSLSGDELRQSYKEPITLDDVKNLRSIGKKSINDFTQEDLQKAGKWAYKFYEQLKEKSPFFRAWFGDWRAYDDKTKIQVITHATRSSFKAGKIINSDTNRIISWGDQVKGETKTKYGKDSDVYEFLENIEDIASKSILLDSVVSSKYSKSKMLNTTFMHSMYCIIKDDGGKNCLVKLLVEEAFNDKMTADFSRAYELQEIKKVATLHMGVLSKRGLTQQDATIYSVSDLFALVKQYDKTFNPNPIDPMFLNEDGTPKKFYHGSKNGGGFRAFKNWQYFTENKSYAERYTERDNKDSLYEVYIKMEKPFDTRDPECKKIFEQMRMEYGLSELQENGLPDWTDGYDIADFIEENNLDYDGIILDEGGDIVDGKPVSRGLSYVVRSSNQIKSATDNIGTFSKYDSDITYSSDDLNAEVEKLLDRYESGGEMSREEFLQEMDDLYGRAVENYGAFEKGEYNETDIPVPKAVAEDKPTERFARTFVGAAKLTPEMVEQFEEDVLLGEFDYTVASDETAIKKAESVIANGNGESVWEGVLNGKHLPSKNDIAIGEKLLANAVESNDVYAAMKISAELADIFTRAGQIVQAARLLGQMTGAGRLVAAQRMVDTINKDRRAKYGPETPPITIDPKLAEELGKAKTKEGTEQAFGEIMRDVASGDKRETRGRFSCLLDFLFSYK